MLRISVTFTPVRGDWGEQLGWVNATLAGDATGLILRRLMVFRHDPGRLVYSAPAVLGDLPGSQHSCIAFADERHQRRFLAALDAALRVDRPELFATEAPQ
jgi:hypothetical protein